MSGNIQKSHFLLPVNLSDQGLIRGVRGEEKAQGSGLREDKRQSASATHFDKAIVVKASYGGRRK